jgi:hypothetical protein
MENVSRTRNAGWPQELLDQMYLDEEVLTWAQATGEGEEETKSYTVIAMGNIRNRRLGCLNQRFKSKRLAWFANKELLYVTSDLIMKTPIY